MITIKPFKALAIAAALSTAAGAGVAQQSNQPGAKQQPAVAHGQAATEDFKASMDKMHQAMMANNDADPDRAWALKMIEHHRGAISMSEVVIKHGVKIVGHKNVPGRLATDASALFARLPAGQWPGKPRRVRRREWARRLRYASSCAGRRHSNARCRSACQCPPCPLLRATCTTALLRRATRGGPARRRRSDVQACGPERLLSDRDRPGQP